MDLGIRGKKALVCGASSGLGFACAKALTEAGVHVVIAARREPVLQEALASLRAVNGAFQVDMVVADVTSAQGRSDIFALHPDFDIVVTNAGGPPPGDFRDWSRETWHQAIDANMLAPIEIMKSTVDSMMARGWGAHHQHHVEFGEVTGRRAGLVDRGQKRSHRLRGLTGTPDRCARGHHQQPVAWNF